MLGKDLYEWMEQPDLLTTDTLEELESAVSQYPYFQPLRFLYLKNLYLSKSPNFYSELTKSAVYISDRRKLFYYLSVVEGLWNDVFAYFSKHRVATDSPEKPDTLSLIDSFLSDYAPEMLEQQPVPTHKAARIALATQDYASLLVDDHVDEQFEADLHDAVKLKHHDLIDEFISFAGDGDAMRQQLLSGETDPSTVLPDLDVETDILNEEDLLTESLAKIYIKQKRYYKAIEIIRKLSLKYPEKSIYFADQIRFLEKLIINIKKE
jgi:tetratricopeptide (TPR) repeat protein